ncbi:transposase [Acinetobacter soli]|uniref:transposase n=1 Tax=Acinetobacter soli TaxID=487316 RepID=UPI002091D754|nr:transposase [Acinetobacter soli]
MVIEKCSIAQATEGYGMKKQGLSIAELISKRNKIVYTICGLLVLLTALSFARYFLNFSILYLLILLIPFFTLMYWMIQITEDIKIRKQESIAK